GRAALPRLEVPFDVRELERCPRILLGATSRLAIGVGEGPQAPLRPAGHANRALHSKNELGRTAAALECDPWRNEPGRPASDRDGGSQQVRALLRALYHGYAGDHRLVAGLRTQQYDL